MRRSRSAPSPSTWKNPHCPSRPLSPPVKPRDASSAANTPFSLARAALSGLLIEPKFTRMPADRLDAIASMCASCASFNFISLPAAAARAEHAERAGAVESALVMVRIDRLGHLALDLDAGQIRLEKGGTRCAGPLGDGERR